MADDGLADERSLQGDLRELVDDARDYAGAEFSFQKARAAYIAGQVPAIAVYCVVAFLFVFFALGGLVVGLIFALAPWLTAWGSTAVVCVALIIGAVVCLFLPRRNWRVIAAAFGEGAAL